MVFVLGGNRTTGSSQETLKLFFSTRAQKLYWSRTNSRSRPEEVCEKQLLSTTDCVLVCGMPKVQRDLGWSSGVLGAH